MTGEDLVGRWSLHRTVADHRAGRSGSVVGELTIAADGDRIAWYEEGSLTFGGRTVRVSRTTYLAGEEMTFADGRPFHPWRPGEDVVHPCGADTYVGRIDVDGDTMRTTWRVTGPAKDQLLVTDLTRV